MNTDQVEEAQVVYEQGAPEKVSDPTPKQVFKEGADYQWKADDIFQLTGAELNVLHNTLNVVFNDNRLTDGKRWTLLNALYELTSNLVKRGVEDGLIVEVPKAKSTDTVSPMRKV